MFARTPIAVVLFALLIAGCATPTTDPRRLPAGSWVLDDAHASVIWRVRHFGLAWYTGRFDRLEASLDFDPADPQAAQLTAIIDANSISTGNADFDRDLANGWLHADQHPQIIFTSERIDATHGRAFGHIVMNGRRINAVMEIEFYGGSFNMLAGGDTIGFGADMVIDRTDFAVGSLPASIVGTEIRIHIEAEFLRQGAPS
ncbi:YceI family protein [Maricaulis salignorans]|uniref:Polyisoprenoid-binding protein YceI n=1 Tax=Maricaulis salignorans TaxID=144026 RepID=A0A1G9MKP8_9PROT|nr:YceI family protein [Maricaulis salignorans]SDL74653.1 Polyisoprenoid-binding protein YceI [Maricaulis salignorans]